MRKIRSLRSADGPDYDHYHYYDNDHHHHYYHDNYNYNYHNDDYHYKYEQYDKQYDKHYVDVTNMETSDKRTYRNYVGGNYLMNGFWQLEKLVSQGLYSRHRVLGIGCGSLRAGRYIAMYVNKGNYHGVEPNMWLVEGALKQDLGEDWLKLHRVTISDSEHFEASLNRRFNYVLANSIATHAPRKMVEELMQKIASQMESTGVAFLTYNDSSSDYQGNDWKYPGAVGYRFKTMKSIAESCGLEVTSKEPSKANSVQTWLVLKRIKT